LSFLVGAGLSAAAGWVGMRTATGAAVRTTQAATISMASALRVAFSSGAVMGLTVVALGTFGISALYYAFGGLSGGAAGRSAVGSLFGFSLGASSIALFARVGGGIYTKAADVAGDLSGKVEAGIPEDDPRNPATIADAVGDNVGDVAGMGADLFESYVGSIIATIAIAVMQVIECFIVVSFDSLQKSVVNRIYTCTHKVVISLREMFAPGYRPSFAKSPLSGRIENTSTQRKQVGSVSRNLPTRWRFVLV